MHQQVASPAGDRCFDLAIAQIELCLIDRNLFDVQGRPCRVYGGMVGGESFVGGLGSARVLQTLLLGNQLTFQQCVVSLRIDIGILPLNGVLLERRFGLPQLSAITLRGATNFRTPPGWDTVYTPIFNMIERPVAPMLVVRVETDWYPHETEFRYVLQQGEGISGVYSMPIGQVVFVPREEITLSDCSEEELAAIRQSREVFSREKAALKVTTSYGVSYSPHYLRQSRSTKP